ncbi:hypothetical protein [Sporosarcina sp. FSL K6-5500]|uniref:hypothetical protein n=1 Tax=Sporosarcina sp. FSL K6-5500 TaxID=2921558 RepID=UPI0030FBC3D6
MRSPSLVLDEFQCDVINLERMINQHPQVNHENILAFEDVQHRASYMEKNSYG